jgi:hypothetical protein
MNRHIFFAVILSITIVACVGTLSDMPERQYASVDQAARDGWVGEHRWIPAILPSDAHAIREVHDIDTNLTWGCFSTGDVDEVRARLARLKARRGEGPIGPLPREWLRDFSWWPQTMSGGTVEAWQFTETAVAARGLSFVVRVGIDRESTRVCFHRNL